MKRFTKLFIPAIILIFNCCSENKRSFRNNWYACTEENGYLELYVERNYFQFATESEFYKEEFDYEFSSDTLIYNDPLINVDSLQVKKVFVSFPSDSVMLWDYFKLGEKWEFRKLNTKNKLNAENKDGFFEHISERAKIFCPKYNEEALKDSLENFIYFQF